MGSRGIGLGVGGVRWEVGACRVGSRAYEVWSRGIYKGVLGWGVYVGGRE